MNSFITGVDHNHEWMLKWWYDNVRRHNQSYITICDFGMSEEGADWARQVADHFIPYKPHPKCAWFYKTQCLLDSPFKRNCWLDSDCEVVASIDDIFNYATPGKVGLTKDVPRYGIEWWATGVVVIEGKPQVLKDWNSVCKAAQVRGDQEAFKTLNSSDIVEIPNEYQWLRLQLARGIDSPTKKVIHWTGPHGKAHIRKLV